MDTILLDYSAAQHKASHLPNLFDLYRIKSNIRLLFIKNNIYSSTIQDYLTNIMLLHLSLKRIS